MVKSQKTNQNKAYVCFIVYSNINFAIKIIVISNLTEEKCDGTAFVYSTYIKQMPVLINIKPRTV